MTFYKKSLPGGGIVLRRTTSAPAGFTAISEAEFNQERAAREIEWKRLRAVADGDTTAASRYAAAKLALTT